MLPCLGSRLFEEREGWAIPGPAQVHNFGENRTITGFVGSFRSAGWCIAS